MFAMDPRLVSHSTAIGKAIRKLTQSARAARTST